MLGRDVLLHIRQIQITDFFEWTNNELGWPGCGNLWLGATLEGQQQQLRVAFRGIYTNVGWLLKRRLGRLDFPKYYRTRDPAVKAEIDRLTVEAIEINTGLESPTGNVLRTEYRQNEDRLGKYSNDSW